MINLASLSGKIAKPEKREEPVLRLGELAALAAHCLGCELVVLRERALLWWDGSPTHGSNGTRRLR